MANVCHFCGEDIVGDLHLFQTDLRVYEPRPEFLAVDLLVRIVKVYYMCTACVAVLKAEGGDKGVAGSLDKRIDLMAASIQDAVA